MSVHGWTADAPSGVYKNHKLSAKIRMAAIAEAKFMQFVKPEPGYGKKMGESIAVTRVSNVTVPTSDVLAENVRIPEDTVSLSTQSITVSERGRAIPYTSLSIDLAHFDLENAIQAKLRDQLSLSMDNAAATAFKAGMIKAIPTGVSTLTMDTDGTASSSATVNLNMYHVEQIRDQMYGTYNIRPYMGDDYVAIISYKAKRGLMNDPAWVDWKKYTDPSAKFNGEIGRIENIRFIEQNNTTALSASKGTGSVLGEGVFFGEDPVVMGVVQDPELRAKESDDYGRSKGVAWYGVYGYGQVWSDSANAGEARVIHLTSS
jgi:N4-gp56 family major capsid protein